MKIEVNYNDRHHTDWNVGTIANSVASTYSGIFELWRTFNIIRLRRRNTDGGKESRCQPNENGYNRIDALSRRSYPRLAGVIKNYVAGATNGADIHNWPGRAMEQGNGTYLAIDGEDALPDRAD